MNASFDFEAPEHFTAGTVGPPGQRVFYLQAREAGVVATLKVEKEQVGALAEYLGRLLQARPADRAEGGEDDQALIEPLDPAWAVGSIRVGYDEAADRIVVEAEELREEDEEGDAAAARFRLSRAQATAFVGRARALIQAGRPACPVCGQPKNPQGHACPRSNGHGRT